MVVDIQAGTWEFYVDDVKYNAPDPLGFRGTPTMLDRVSYFTESAAGAVIDAVSVGPAPGPGGPLRGTATVTIEVTAILDPPVVTTPAGPATLNADAIDVTGTAEANSLVRVYLDQDNNGSVSAGDPVVGSRQLTGGQA